MNYAEYLKGSPIKREKLKNNPEMDIYSKEEKEKMMIEECANEDIKLEEILEKLEIANNELNKTDIELDKSIEIYTEAMKLVSVGNEKLKKAEEKIAKFIDEKEQKEIEE